MKPTKAVREEQQVQHQAVTVYKMKLRNALLQIRPDRYERDGESGQQFMEDANRLVESVPIPLSYEELKAEYRQKALKKEEEKAGRESLRMCKKYGKYGRIPTEFMREEVLDWPLVIREERNGKKHERRVSIRAMTEADFVMFKEGSERRTERVVNAHNYLCDAADLFIEQIQTREASSITDFWTPAVKRADDSLFGDIDRNDHEDV